MKRVEGFGDLTPDQKARLAQLAARPESEIDTSTIPEWTEADFDDAIRLQGRPLVEVLRLYKVRKAAITARIDLDVLEWLKSKGEGYQTRLNAILRDAMAQDRTARPRKARPAASDRPKSAAAKNLASKHPKAGVPQNAHLSVGSTGEKKTKASKGQKAKASKPAR